MFGTVWIHCPGRRLLSYFYQLRLNHPLLLDGFNLIHGVIGHTESSTPGSNHTITKIGLWSLARSPIPQVQKLNLTTPSDGTGMDFHHQWEPYIELFVQVLRCVVDMVRLFAQGHHGPLRFQASWPSGSRPNLL
jgi:hypothetical protein